MGVIQIKTVDPISVPTPSAGVIILYGDSNDRLVKIKDELGGISVVGSYWVKDLSDNLYYDAVGFNNMGVGTNSPDYRLHVDGTFMSKHEYLPDETFSAFVSEDISEGALAPATLPGTGHYYQSAIAPNTIIFNGIMDLRGLGGELRSRLLYKDDDGFAQIDATKFGINHTIIAEAQNSLFESAGFRASLNGGVIVSGKDDQPLSANLTCYDSLGSFVFRVTNDGSTGIGKDASSSLGFFGLTPAAKQVMNPYTSDDESAAYSGIDNAQGGLVYAKHADISALRAAYENLRVYVEEAVNKIQVYGLLG